MDIPPTVMQVIEQDEKVRFFTDDATGFKVYDFRTSTCEIVSPSNATPEQLGPPVSGVPMSDAMVICYKSILS